LKTLLFLFLRMAKIHFQQKKPTRLAKLILCVLLLGCCAVIQIIHYCLSNRWTEEDVIHLSSPESNTGSKSPPEKEPPVLFKHPAALTGVHNTSSHAIISLASNYNLHIHKTFTGSVRKSGYLGDIVLVVEEDIESKDNGKTFKYLQNLNVILYPLRIKCGDSNRAAREKGCVWTGFDGKSEDETDVYRPVAMMRYDIYLALSKIYDAHGPTTWILLCDYRDVFFQDDPFKFVPNSVQPGEKPLWVFEEDKRVHTMGSCPFNRGWVTSCWGRSAIDPYKKEAIRNAGDTMGTTAAMIIYNKVMVEEIKKKKCHGYGQDQGYHNWLILHGDFEAAGAKITSWYRGDGPVNVVGLLDQLWKDRSKASLRKLGILDSENYVLNRDNITRSPCIHQWDRFANEIRGYVNTRGLTFDESVEWAKRYGHFDAAQAQR